MLHQQAPPLSDPWNALTSPHGKSLRKSPSPSEEPSTKVLSRAVEMLTAWNILQTWAAIVRLRFQLAPEMQHVREWTAGMSRPCRSRKHNKLQSNRHWAAVIADNTLVLELRKCATGFSTVPWTVLRAVASPCPLAKPSLQWALCALHSWTQTVLLPRSNRSEWKHEHLNIIKLAWSNMNKQQQLCATLRETHQSTFNRTRLPFGSSPDLLQPRRCWNCMWHLCQAQRCCLLWPTQRSLPHKAR